MANPSLPARRAVLFDFGGVLTTGVLAAFAEFGRELGDSRLPLRVVASDEQGKNLLKAHEEGRIDQAVFERGLADRFAAHGAAVPASGLLRRMQAGLRPDSATIDLVRRLRSQGWPVGLLSNSLGDDCYAGFDLPEMFDAVTISAEIGVRKPSREAYRIACRRLGVRPEETVMVDDLEQNIAAAGRLGMAGVVHTDAVTTEAELTALLGH
ncbi:MULTISPECIES: HAD family hydrolase [Prauserella salsuginis group]|uniref:HAD family hydrolase n=1 Tax=Prauserella salsuginis TaxID=387889 RepID=A0ABW6FWJ1_9PSEU|nr:MULTISPECIES: HAD family phosphatase [Prauserella salsuginis group]MCR3720132.1 putative hydrolase of the HAD superfamily [Prauserella flava]MCR3734159.1 putative hydrolase of the HAD superfamily [Prauserella salsuginis]